MRIAALVAAFGYAASVVADGNTIAAAINLIDSDVANVNQTINQWDGGLITALVILAAAIQMNADITNGTSVAQASGNLDTNGAVKVYDAVNHLKGDANITITTLIKNKPRFTSLVIVDPIINAVLQMTKSNTDNFASAVLPKIPSSYQSIAKGVVADIDGLLNKAIGEFGGSGGGSAGGGSGTGAGGLPTAIPTSVPTGVLGNGAWGDLISPSKGSYS